MGVIKTLFLSVAGLVALIAVGIGTVGKVDPWLFMSIKKPAFGPGPGALMWLMSGNPFPPYMDNFKPWQDRGWLKKDDVVVSVGAKSGTTWMLYCAHQIRTKAKDTVPFVDVNINTPWVELSQQPRQEWPEIRELLNTTKLKDGTALKDYWDHPSYPFRVFKGHAQPVPGQLDVRANPHVKYIAAARTGLDVVASMAPFLCNHQTEFLEMWGGMDALQANCGGDPKAQLDQTFGMFMPGGEWATLYWDYVKGWWPYRNDKNVLLMHYNDMVGDHDALIKKLAAFLGVDLAEEEFAAVSERCTFKYMKKNAEVSYHLPFNKELYSKGITGMHGADLLKSGKTGRGKAQFSPAQQETWAKTEVEMFPDEQMRQWARNGGPLP